MIIRLEFSKPQSLTFPWVLRLCRKIKTFKEFDEEGLHIYSIEVTDSPKDISTLEAIHWKIHAWKNIAYYIDDALISPGEMFRYFQDRRFLRGKLRKLPAEDIIKGL